MISPKYAGDEGERESENSIDRISFQAFLVSLVLVSLGRTAGEVGSVVGVVLQIVLAPEILAGCDVVEYYGTVWH